MRRSTALRILPSFASEIIVFAGYRHPLAGKYPPIMHEKTLKRLLYLYLETPAPGDVLRVYGKPRNTTLRQVLATAEWDVQIGRASCRERVESAGVDVAMKER